MLPSNSETAQLSISEQKILAFIKEGLSTKQIAARLFLSAYTVDTHRKNICRKLGLKAPNSILRYLLEVKQ